MARDLEKLAAQGERLQHLRGPLGGQTYRITQREVADAIGITQRMYQAYEGGESGIGADKLARLGAFFDVDPDWILNGDREPSQLDRIEAKLDAVLDAMQSAMPVDVGAILAPALAAIRAEAGEPTPQNRPAPLEVAIGGKRPRRKTG